MIFKRLAEKYGLPPKTVHEALFNIAEKKCLFLTVSGKIGSGKDTIAPLLTERLGYTAEHVSFAKPLRDEINQVIEIIENTDTIETAIQKVSIDLDAEKVDEIVEKLYNDVKNGVVESSYDRTPSTRFALQHWGTEIRRAKNEDYWVDKAMNNCLQKFSKEKSVYVTDSRFPNEANAIKEAGGVIIRLTVSPEEQQKRIFERDGKIPTKDAILHSSETAMDDYIFPITVDTDNKPVEEVVEEAYRKIMNI